MIFTTNKPLTAWGRVLHDEDLAQAILDRILERGRLLTLEGPRCAPSISALTTRPPAEASSQPARISGNHRPEFPEPSSATASRSAPAIRSSCRAGSSPAGSRPLLRSVRPCSSSSDEVRRQLDAGPAPPQGYNIGVNIGEAAGQTVPHLHVHVIPRYRGDVPDPRGGVRHVIPGKGNYLADRVMPPGPEPERQVQFLFNVQRLLSDGTFVATYKFALLLSLGGSCGGAVGGAGRRCVWSRCLWTRGISRRSSSACTGARSCRGYTSGSGAAGAAPSGGGLCGGHLEPRWRRARTGSRVLSRASDATGRPGIGSWRDVARTIEVMPLWKLQTVGHDKLDFLYPNVGKGSRLRLHGEAVYCLRRFRDLIGDMAETAWVRFVRRLPAQPRSGSGAGRICVSFSSGPTARHLARRATCFSRWKATAASTARG